MIYILYIYGPKVCQANDDDECDVCVCVYIYIYTLGMSTLTHAINLKMLMSCCCFLRRLIAL